ncbi:adenosylhomocysteinase [Candidatus Kryptobacter tengchongensis]|uniref:Adenosylhomocysteinase n=1 Tax=Kryptobacter tengchongensis TaxID=1643429 RepID=A0A656D0F5_KRYT1|nr:adenosylhomocysteinase [Candidatus Kryptobacter tengchongensis]CUS91908.1 adenosylhomocysteinase [Candidatus Kryptobacter tengchongensis]CUS95983.1 adenosylhomocysteinase [Candidatus Kryptobacter tengchongensis]CUT02526.1 adenosylhomocysteinase [Candidatus Kryptobacter tengchongensis]CUU00684.1 adenosylhomocysteinase [Candidatus Kryptobacter tengchongensis]CUU09367.1 adenosylhomocysteinase [Candidatus Kryptobacter tengchongensis]
MDEVKGVYKVRDLSLADEGLKQIRWAESRMPVLMALREKYSKTKPFKGFRIAGCLHVTKETAVLVKTFVECGAEVSWSGCNPLSTQDTIAAALAKQGISIFAWNGMSVDEFYWAIEQTLHIKPNLTLDDGADLIFTIHSKHPELIPDIIGGTEETTTGVKRLRAMAEAGALKYPIIAVNDAETKWDFDNVYGTGQSTLDGILRATSILIAGKNVVVAGYGHCGKGVAMRARGLGANVIVTEVRPIAALKAVLDGFTVMPMKEAAKIGDVFITATGVKDVITEEHFKVMKDGAIVCNTGHYDVEINLVQLKKMAKSIKEIRNHVEEYILKDGKRIFVLAKGRLVNLVAAEGHPSEVMDMSFANQFMAQLRLVELFKKGKKLEPKVYDIPPEQDEEIAELKLKTMGIKIDKLTKEQRKYIKDYSAGT